VSIKKLIVQARPGYDTVAYMRIPGSLVLLLALSIAALPADNPSAAIRPSKTIKLFNGKNLDGWYAWLRDTRYDDPKHVFSVRDGMLRISGEVWGGIATRNAYRDYHLIVEWKWGGATWGDRKERARDSGILVHGVGEDGAAGGVWLESIESQVIEGGAGDFILVAGKNRPSLTAEVRGDEHGETWWHKGGEVRTRDRGRFNWYGRDPQWKDVLGFHGREDVQKPLGEWNRQQVIADGDSLTNIVNGVTVNHATRSSLTAGKIQLQSEGAEILIRKVELRPVKHGSK
jgi:hypothetical protein